MLLSLNAIGGQSHGTDTTVLVLSSSFTVTVCTVRDYHCVEFQAIIITN